MFNQLSELTEEIINYLSVLHEAVENKDEEECGNMLSAVTSSFEELFRSAGEDQTQDVEEFEKHWTLIKGLRGKQIEEIFDDQKNVLKQLTEIIADIENYRERKEI